MSNLRGQRHLKHGGNESRGKPVSGHVGNENAEVLIVDLNEIVEITTDRSHGTEARDNLEPRKLRQSMRKNGKLNLPGHLEFIVECQQLCGELRTAFAKQDMASHTSLDDGRRKGLVNVIHRTDF